MLTASCGHQPVDWLSLLPLGEEVNGIFSRGR
jgi:hypothetical protein